VIFIQCFTFRASLIYVNSHLGSRHYYDASPIYSVNKSIEAFNQGISEYAFNSYLVMHSEVRSEARKHQAWVEDKVDEEIAKNNQVEEADESKLNVEYTLTTNTCVKNKIPN
jgi:hypothetical protein